MPRVLPKTTDSSQLAREPDIVPDARVGERDDKIDLVFALGISKLLREGKSGFLHGKVLEFGGEGRNGGDPVAGYAKAARSSWSGGCVRVCV